MTRLVLGVNLGLMEMVAIRKVTLQEHHLRPGRTRHTLVDGHGPRPFPPFISLVIARYPEDTRHYLMRHCKDHIGTDTCHESLEDALRQAEWEFGVLPEEWLEVQEPF